MIRRLRTEEHGFVLATAIGLLLVSTLLAVGAIAWASSASDGAHRDQRTRRAVQAAEAGAEAAVWRLNVLSEATSDASSPAPCPQKTGEDLRLVAAQPVAGKLWCPAVTETVGGNATFSYALSSPADTDFDGFATTVDRTVLATGTAGGVSRRIAMRVSAFHVGRIFRDYAVSSIEDLDLSNSAWIGSVQVAGNARSNGDILIANNARICGHATPGPDHTVVGQRADSVCSGYSTAPAEEPLELRNIDLGDATPNDNAGICSPGCPSGVTWSGRHLAIANAPLTLTGNTFFLCSLTMTGGSASLRFSPTDASRPVRVYIDSPANCGNPAKSISLQQAPTITNLSAPFPIAQFYVAGDASAPTSIALGNNNSNNQIGMPMVIYAPNSEVSLQQYAIVNGGIAARRVAMENHTRVNQASNVGDLVFDIAPKFERRRWVECSAAAPPAAAPDGGC